VSVQLSVFVLCLVCACYLATKDLCTLYDVLAGHPVPTLARAFGAVAGVSVLLLGAVAGVNDVVVPLRARSKVVRKSIARLLTVISQQQRSALREAFKGKVGSQQICHVSRAAAAAMLVAHQQR